MRFASSQEPGFERTWLYRYKAAIDSGEVVVGVELTEMLEQLMDSIGDRGTYYDTKTADDCIDFLEHCCKQTKGEDFYGEYFKLMLWQKAFIEAMFSVKQENGMDRFKRILLLVARKNGKSQMCSGLILFALLFCGRGLDIVCSSNTDAQANILYDECNTMRVLIDPKSLDIWKSVSDMRVRALGNKVFKLSDSTRNKEGFNIDYAFIDEVHEMGDNAIVKSIEQSQSVKKNPKLVMITTEGFVNDGFLDAELKRARGIIRGEVDDDASWRYLPWLYTQDSEQEIWRGNEENRLWTKSNPSLGIIKTYDYMREQVALAKESTSERAFVLAKDFNIKQGNSTAWLRLEDYEYESPVRSIEDFEKSIGVGGVDIAETTDLSCARICFFPAGNVGNMWTLSHYFMPASKLKYNDDKKASAQYEKWIDEGYITIQDGSYLDASIIASWFDELYENHGIYVPFLGYDDKFSVEFVKKAKYFGMTPEKILQNPFVMHTPIQMVESDLKQHRILGLNEVDRWCLGNAAIQTNSYQKVLLVKIRGQQARRIDGAVTLAIAYETYRRHREEYEGYLERGLAE